MCYDAADAAGRCSRRASTASTSTRPGTATRASIRCTATATRCGATRPTIRRTAPPSSRRTRRTSCSRRSRRPRTSTSATAAGAIDHGRFNEAYCSQASTSPLYALIASNDVAAAMMDGPAGQALTQDVIDEAVACRLAVARIRQEFLAKKDWFFAPWNAEEITDPKTGKRVAVPRGAGRAARDGPELLGAASGRELARLRRHPRRLVHARPDQVRHRLPRHEAGRRSSTTKGIPADIVTRLPRPPRHRAVAHHRPHGAVPVLRGHHQGEVGHAASTRCSTSRPTTTATRRSPRSLPGVVAAAPEPLRRDGAQGPRRRDVGAHEEEQAGTLAGAGLRHPARRRR